MAIGIGDLAVNAIEQAVGFGVGQGLGAALAPEATRLAQEAWKTDPGLAIDPQTAAMLTRLGILTADQGAAEAAQYGVSHSKFLEMVRGNRNPPPPGEMLELARRNVITADQLTTALLRAGIDDRYVENYKDLLRVHLSPQDAAMARQQGFLNVEESHAVAALSGVVASDSDIMYEMSGLPPGVGEAVTLLRRGLIDEAKFAVIVREGHTKTKYTQDMLNLRWQPLSAALAAEALVRERTTQAHAEQIAAQNGMRPEDFALYVELLGRPMGIGQALTLVRRGEMNSTQFRQVVARSDVKTEYADDLLKLAVVYPPLFQLSRLVTSGAITDDDAKTILRKEGYPPVLVDGIVAGAHKSKTATTRHLSVGIIETLLEAGLTTHAKAEVALKTLGYNVEEADELLEVYEARRIVQEVAHGVNVVRNRYTGWKIDATKAQTELASLDVDPQTIARLLKHWKAERDANQPVLTAPEIVAAFHYDRFTYDVAVQRLQLLGWSPDDALTLLWIRNHGDPTHPKPTQPETPPIPK